METNGGADSVRAARERATLGGLLVFGGSLAVLSVTPALYDWGLVTIVLLLSMAMGTWLYPRGPGLVIAYFTICIVVLLIVAFTPTSRLLAIGLTRRDAQPTEVDAIIALSSAISSDGHLGPDSIDRLLGALALVRSGISTTLIVTRPALSTQRRARLIVDQERVIALVRPDLRILAIDSVTSTRTEATGAAALAPALRIRSIAVVTSPLHSYRACAVFERAGFRVACLPAESRSISFGQDATVRDRMRAFRSAVYERLAVLQYRARNWM